MTIQNYSEDEFKKILKALKDDLLAAGHYNRLYTKLSNDINEYRQETNKSPAFWGLTLDAYVQSSFLHLCIAYDTEKSSLSLGKFLHIVEKNINLFDSENFRERLKDNPDVNFLAETPRTPTLGTTKQVVIFAFLVQRGLHRLALFFLKNYLILGQLQEDLNYVREKTNPKVKKLTRLRGHSLVHKGLKKVVSNSSNEESLTWGDLEELIDRGLEIFNRYLYLFESAIACNELMQEDDYKYVLQSLAIRQKTQAFINNTNQLQILKKDTPDKIKEEINKLGQEIHLIIYPHLSNL